VTVLLWVAVLVTGWFAASLVVALVVGRYLRRCADGIEVTAVNDAMRPLDTGPLRVWLADLPDGADLVRSGARVPAPRDTEVQPGATAVP
jgi:hypothetical protein